MVSPLVGADPSVVDFTLEPEESTGDVGTSASVAVDSAGQPHIAYLDLTNNSLRYAWRDQDGWHTESVAAADVQRNCSLTLAADGTPIISLRRDLDDPGGGCDWRPGRWLSLVVDSQGEVHIAYYDATTGICAMRRPGAPCRCARRAGAA